MDPVQRESDEKYQQLYSLVCHNRPKPSKACSYVNCADQHLHILSDTVCLLSSTSKFQQVKSKDPTGQVERPNRSSAKTQQVKSKDPSFKLLDTQVAEYVAGTRSGSCWSLSKTSSFQVNDMRRLIDILWGDPRGGGGPRPWRISARESRPCY